jgi:hypothetical protein
MCGRISEEKHFLLGKRSIRVHIYISISALVNTFNRKRLMNKMKLYIDRACIYNNRNIAENWIPYIQNHHPMYINLTLTPAKVWNKRCRVMHAISFDSARGKMVANSISSALSSYRLDDDDGHGKIANTGVNLYHIVGCCCCKQRKCIIFSLILCFVLLWYYIGIASMIAALIQVHKYPMLSLCIIEIYIYEIKEDPCAGSCFIYTDQLWPNGAPPNDNRLVSLFIWIKVYIFTLMTIIYPKLLETSAVDCMKFYFLHRLFLLSLLNIYI